MSVSPSLPAPSTASLRSFSTRRPSGRSTPRAYRRLLLAPAPFRARDLAGTRRRDALRAGFALRAGLRAVRRFALLAGNNEADLRAKLAHSQKLRAEWRK